MIICNDYIRDSPHNKATQFGIYSPTLHLDDKLGLDKSHGFICHKLRDNQRIENVTFNTGLSLFGKYMNFQTSIKIGCDNDSRLNNFNHCYSPYLGHFDTSREATTARRKLRETGETPLKDGVKHRIIGQIYCQNNYEDFEC